MVYVKMVNIKGVLIQYLCSNTFHLSISYHDLNQLIFIIKPLHV